MFTSTALMKLLLSLEFVKFTFIRPDTLVIVLKLDACARMKYKCMCYIKACYDIIYLINSENNPYNGK